MRKKMGAQSLHTMDRMIKKTLHSPLSIYSIKIVKERIFLSWSIQYEPTKRFFVTMDKVSG